MTWLSRGLLIVASAALFAAPHALAQDGEGGGDGESAAAKPPDLFDQVDRKHTMSIKLPRAWKTVTGEDATQGALATFAGPFGEEGKSPPGQVDFFTYGQFQRAGLARAVIFGQTGK